MLLVVTAFWALADFVDVPIVGVSCVLFERTLLLDNSAVLAFLLLVDRVVCGVSCRANSSNRLGVVLGVVPFESSSKTGFDIPMRFLPLTLSGGIA